MDGSKSIAPIVQENFKMETDNSVEDIMKYGIHTTVAKLMMAPGASKEQIQLSAVSALEKLANIDPQIQLDVNSKNDGETHSDRGREARNAAFETCYFSLPRGGLVEFSVNSTTKKYEVQVRNAESIIDQPKAASTEQKQNEAFKVKFMDVLNAYLLDDTELLILSGVILSLEFGEQTEGRFKYVFEKHRALFDKLAQVYQEETIPALIASHGSYSPWFAVDETVEKYEKQKEAEVRARYEQEKEDDWRMRIC